MKFVPRLIALQSVLTRDQHGGEKFKHGVKNFKFTVNNTIVKEECSFFPVLGAISAGFVSSLLLRSRPGLGRMAATVSSTTVIVAYYPKTTIKAYKTLVKPLFTSSPATPPATPSTPQPIVNAAVQATPLVVQPATPHVEATTDDISRKVQEVIDTLPVEKLSKEVKPAPAVEEVKKTESETDASATNSEQPAATENDDEVIEVIEEIVIEEVEGDAGNDDVVIIETTTTEEATSPQEPQAHHAEQQSEPEGDMGQSEPEDLQTYPKRSESPQ